MLHLSLFAIVFLSIAGLILFTGIVIAILPKHNPESYTILSSNI